MTDLNEWISERRRIHDAATEGWREFRTSQSPTFWLGVEDKDEEMLFWDAGFGVIVAESENAHAIVDAHNTLPRALAALEKVLELHEPVESLHGDYLCSTCAERDNCTVAMVWPCPTVRAIEGAINEQ